MRPAIIGDPLQWR